MVSHRYIYFGCGWFPGQILGMIWAGEWWMADGVSQKWITREGVGRGGGMVKEGNGVLWGQLSETKAKWTHSKEGEGGGFRLFVWCPCWCQVGDILYSICNVEGFWIFGLDRTIFVWPTFKSQQPYPWKTKRTLKIINMRLIDSLTWVWPLSHKRSV